MKGQYRLVNEVFLFILGILIASLVAFSLSSMEKSMNRITTEDHLTTVSNFLATGIIKTFESGENSSLILRIPRYLSGKSYRINAIDDKLVVSLYNDTSVNVTHELFNISSGKIIIGNVTSSAEYIMISNNETAIEMKSLSAAII